MHLTNFDIIEVPDQASLTSVIDTAFTVASTAVSGQITVEALFYTDNITIAWYPNAGSINIVVGCSQLLIDVVDSASVFVLLMVNGTLESRYLKIA